MKKQSKSEVSIDRVLDPLPMDHAQKYTLQCLKCGGKTIDIDDTNKTATCLCGTNAGFEMIRSRFSVMEKKRKWIVGEIEKDVPVSGVVIDDDLIRKMRSMEIGDSVTVTGGLDVSLRSGVSLRARIISKERGEKLSFMVKKQGAPEGGQYRMWRIETRKVTKTN